MFPSSTRVSGTGTEVSLLAPTFPTLSRSSMSAGGLKFHVVISFDRRVYLVSLYDRGRFSSGVN